MPTSHSLAAQLKHIRERSEQIVTLLYANKASLGGYWAHEGMYVSVDDVRTAQIEVKDALTRARASLKKFDAANKKGK